MAALGVAVTLEEVTKRLDPDGKISKIVEILAKQNAVLEDMRFVEGNLTTGHRVTVRTGLPAVGWRKYNQGIAKSKSKTLQVDESCGMCEGWAEVDKDLANLNNNSSDFRASEDMAFLEAINQEMATKLFYGDTGINPEAPLGLSPRYPYSDSPNVVDFGGSGSDCTSIWLVTWGDNNAFGIYPKGSVGGFNHTDLGEQILYDADNNQYMGYKSHYKWDMGLVVKDWRSVVRCCNIESDGLTGTGTNNLIDKLHLLIKAKNKLRHKGFGAPVIYCNSDVMTQFDVAAYNKTTPSVYVDTTGGKHQTYFMGIPIKLCESILSTETALTATP